MSEPKNPIVSGDAEQVKQQSARRTRRSFVVGGIAAAGGYGGLRWIANSTDDHGLPSAIRKTLNVDALMSREVFKERGLAPTYSAARAQPLRVNGLVGLDMELQPEAWRLQLAGIANPERYPQFVRDVTAWEYKYGPPMPTDVVPSVKTQQTPSRAAKLPGKPAVKTSEASNNLNPSGATNSAAGDAIAARFEALARQSNTSKKRHEGTGDAGASASGLDIGTPGLLLTMDDLLKLPQVELITEFKCIEGWSNITQWGGVRLRDLIEAYPPERWKDDNDRHHDPTYVYMETPDGNYYCGYSMEAARHPQSLLVTHMGGEPLAQEQGAPLRLHMPIKYGYKQLKRIGLIAYTRTKPDDYWAKLGYDWYAGL